MFRHVQFGSGLHVMAAHEISRNRPEIIFSFRIIHRWVILMWGWRRESAWFSSSGRSRMKVDVLRRWSPPETLAVPSATGNFKLSHFIGVNTSFALSLRTWISDASICSISWMSVIDMSPFQIPPACIAYPRNIPNWCNLDRSFAEIGWYSTIAPNGITGPLNGIPNRLSYGVLPSDKRSWMFRR